ncbi:hypothetical protein RirG_140930 [Rhizophagus irregularis DAOM 197198w]|uniref:Uncharacterized protein n=1 Tax=Rhizophagus irregularis (strain DAOM 197198w) TaxID=1432141 RepID=A0A015KB09_RHIIW|nr:hypothetical protein RirG_140930 [Rhizophagus irregularis DAOM 197198w]
MNNHYYANIVINGTINDYLPHVLRNEDNEDIIARSFVPFAPSSHCEDDSINEVLVRMQKKTTPIVSFVWPNIDSIPINEFHTPRYITRAFPTLYPYGKADLCAGIACKKCKACRVFSTLA